jgi:hypothetical protein
MKTRVRLDLIFRDASEEELAGLASKLAKGGGDVRWRTGEHGRPELHVRLRSPDDLERPYQYLGEIAERYFYRGF